MSAFPGPHAQVYTNEAGEPIGWDYPPDPAEEAYERQLEWDDRPWQPEDYDERDYEDEDDDGTVHVYRVTLTTTVELVVEVDASNSEDAEMDALDLFNNELHREQVRVGKAFVTLEDEYVRCTNVERA